MINIVVGSTGADVAEVLARAFERSYTRGQVRLVDSVRALPGGGVAVVPSPRDADLEWLEAFARRPSKIVLLGPLGPAMAAWAGVGLSPLAPRLAEAAACAPAPLHGMAASQAAIAYSDVGLGACSPLRSRHLCRFDFTSEWNNLGYGRIGIGDDPWSIAVAARADHATVVGELVLDDGMRAGAVATVRDTPTASILWFARPVGPVDGADWRIVEAFISDYRGDALPCRPHLRDIPHGAAAAVTMRLDCDEDIAIRPAAARPLPRAGCPAVGRGHDRPAGILRQCGPARGRQTGRRIDPLALVDPSAQLGRQRRGGGGGGDRVQGLARIPRAGSRASAMRSRRFTRIRPMCRRRWRVRDTRASSAERSATTRST